MKIVTNGKDLFAIRRGIWPVYRYFDLRNPGFWWRKGSKHYADCWSRKPKAEAWFGLLNPKVYKETETSQIDKELKKLDEKWEGKS